MLSAAGVLLLVFASSSPQGAQPDASLLIERGVTEDGRATESWLVMIRARLAGAEYEEAASLRRPLTPAEQAWEALIRSRSGGWGARRDRLQGPFRPIEPPARVRIILGNRGGEDAFTHDPTTIGFDLSKLHAAYGDASLGENSARIDRFFDHEYTHLLQKAWLAGRPYSAGTPLGSAILDIWLEGLANYHSLSDSWRSSGGEPSAKAAQTLATLEPRFVARLSALSCAPPARGARLMADLSMGRFDAKWGALPAALWLEREAGQDPEALRRFVQAGPDGVWELAARHLPPPLRAALAEARTAASLCPAD